MTSDAKIGLLVGLLVIFIIAFIINGLPRLRADQSGNDLMTQGSYLSLDSPGIAARERNAQHYFRPTSNLARIARHAVEQQTGETEQSSEARSHVRSSIPLPISLFAKQTPIQPPKDTLTLNTVDKESIAEVARDVTQKKLPKDKRLSSFVYKVQPNDSLASIAQKLYGPVEGNKKININRLFEANRLKIKSPDEIYVGQKLIIPPLPNSKWSKRLSNVTIPVDLPVISPGQIDHHTASPTNRADDNQWYVVCEGDSLWKIAQARLGNGARYTEIARLNTDVISDEDNLSTGMRLRLPLP